MVRLALVVFVTACVLAVDGTSTAAMAGDGSNETAVLERVVDGDTLELSDGTRVRLIGINTPEINHPEYGDECFGDEASRFAEGLLDEGDRIRLVRDVEEFDQYGRLLAYVYRSSDDLFINAELVRRGFAYVETVPPNVEHAKQFKKLARRAREREAGLWSTCPTAGGQPRSLVDTCLPGYQGACVPPLPPDLDCDDLSGPIAVVGADPHKLDADGDGRACEPDPRS